MSTVVITGANRGIGLELARIYKGRGEDVIALCRKASPALRDLGVRIEEAIDVVSEDLEVTLKNRLNNVAIDLLINNAGILEYNELDNLDLESIRRQFEVNAVGPLRVSSALYDHFASPAKLAFITSRMGSVADNTSGGRYGYRASKCALNMFAKSLSVDLAPKNISVAILHPGFVRTEMTGGNGHVEPQESANNLVSRIDEMSMENTGSFRHANGEVLPW